jgi:NADPH:quinone reductase-like Zn-dependent oxidoreductase
MALRPWCDPSCLRPGRGRSRPRCRRRSRGRFHRHFRQGYVDLALELKVSPDRINTIIDFQAVEKFKVKAEGSQASANGTVLAELVGLMAKGQLEVPVAKTYPLAQVREAFRDLMQRHTRGKVVLIP